MFEKYLGNRFLTLYVIPFTIGSLTILSFEPNTIFVNNQKLNLKTSSSKNRGYLVNKEESGAIKDIDFEGIEPINNIVTLKLDVKESTNTHSEFKLTVK